MPQCKGLIQFVNGVFRLTRIGLFRLTRNGDYRLTLTFFNFITNREDVIGISPSKVVFDIIESPKNSITIYM